MKKYTIKDKNGIKKTIYAKDLAHALTFVDSSLNDSTYELYLGNYFSSDDWPQIRNTIKRYGLYVGEYRKGMQTITVRGDRKNIEKLLEYFGHHKGYSKEYNNIKDSRIEDDTWSRRVDEFMEHFGGAQQSSITKIIAEMKKYGYSDVAKDETKLRKYLKRNWDYLKDSIKDEANLPTTIQALVNDEEAAIKAYEVAIKNLEGKIDEIQMQVLVNILKDERKHIENLYAILNGQVTQKNLEDSKIKDEIITIGNTEYRLYSRYGSYHLDELKTNDRVADFDSYSEAMAAIRQWKKLGYITDSIDDKITEKNLEDSIKDATLQITVRNQQEYREIDKIAERLHLAFYETTGNKAILEGTVKNLEEYVDLVWGGDASIKRQIKR